MTSTTFFSQALPTVGADSGVWGAENNSLHTFWDSLVAGASRSYLSGLTLSAAGATSTFGVAAGACIDSANLNGMVLAIAFTKTTASWVVGTGNGALDTGSIAASTWYHVYLIKRADTGLVDVIFSTNATSPTLPANYTLFRRIGSMKTDASNNWTKFKQIGDQFLWDASTADLNAGALPSLARGLTVLTVPPGVKMKALFSAVYTNTGTISGVLFTSPDESDQAQSATNSDLINPAAGAFVAGRFEILTDASAQIGIRAGTAANNSLSIATHGWTDRRGRDA